MFNYILEMMVCQALFLGLYQVFKSEPLFKVNRMYLLFSLLFSLVLPLIIFSDVVPYQVSQTYVQWIEPLQIGVKNTESAMSFSQKQVEAAKGNQWNIYAVIYGIGLVLYLFWFIFRNRQLFNYLSLNSFEDYKCTSVVILPKTATAFSFIDRIYLGAEIPDSQRQVILEHEYQHLQKKHSWDLLFVEGLQLFMWFNPFLYFYKSQLRQLHEFEVDHSVSTQYSSKNYINTLLNLSFGCQNVSFINTFSHKSNLKKRITMLQHAHSTNLKKLKYLLILPVMLLAVLFSCTQDEEFSRDLTQEEMTEQSIIFLDKVFKSKPTIHKIIENKPDLEELLNYYDLEIKDKYSNLEEGKAGFIIGVLTTTNEYKYDASYRNNVLEVINSSKPLKSLYDTLQIIGKRGYREGWEAANFDSDYSKIPFALLDNPPHPNSCEGLTGDELKTCMSDFIGKHVSDTFKIPEHDLPPGRVRISVQFMIDKTGKIKEIKARGPSPELEKEAINTIKSLPEFIPGEQDGEKVNVLYGLPINFVVPE